MEREEENKFMELLKEKIGHKVKLTLHTETRAEELGNMGPISKPHMRDDKYSIAFFGVYGFNERYGFIGKRLLYIHGRDLEDGKDKLFRNNLEIWTDEDTGNPTYESLSTIIKLDDIDIQKWFSNDAIHEDELKLGVEKLRYLYICKRYT